MRSLELNQQGTNDVQKSQSMRTTMVSILMAINYQPKREHNDGAFPLPEVVPASAPGRLVYSSVGRMTMNIQSGEISNSGDETYQKTCQNQKDWLGDF